MAIMLDDDFMGLMVSIMVVALIAIALLLCASTGLGLLFTGIHWRLRKTREQVQGQNSAAVLASRAGSWLGLGAGLGLWLISALLSRFTDATGPFHDLLRYFSVIPMATWGMLAGSIAGNRTDVRRASQIGALMFLLVANPIAWLWAVADTVVLPEHFEQHAALLATGVVRLLLAAAAGAFIGRAAVRAGHRNAEFAAVE